MNFQYSFIWSLIHIDKFTFIMEKQIVSVKRLASGELVAYGLKPNQQIFLQTDGTFKITTTSSTNSTATNSQPTPTNSQPTPSTSDSQPTPSTSKSTAKSSSPSSSEAGSQFSHLQGMFDEEVRKFSASILMYMNQFKSDIVRNS